MIIYSSYDYIYGLFYEEIMDVIKEFFGRGYFII